MKHLHSLPTRRHLLLTWAVLMGLTVASLVAGRAGGDGGSLGWTAVAAVLAVTFFKARQILMVYLNLRASTAMWRTTLAALVLVTCLVIMAGYLLAQAA